MIFNAPDLSPPSPHWRKDAPPSLLCVASNGSVCTVLDSIGPCIDVTDEAGENLSDWLSSGEPVPPGIWIGVLTIHHYEADTYYGKEWDMEMEFTDIRAATDEEVLSLAQGETPWDPSKWMDNWTEVQSGINPLSEMTADLRSPPLDRGRLEASKTASTIVQPEAVPHDFKSYAKSIVSVEVSLDLPSVWADDCSIGQVRLQASKEYQSALNSAIKAVNEGRPSGFSMRIVSSPKVTVVIKDKE